MIWKRIVEESRSSVFLNILRIKHTVITGFVGRCYRNSRIHSLFVGLIDESKKYLRFSFVGRMVESGAKDNSAFLENSAALAWFNKSRKILWGSAIFLINSSDIYDFYFDLKRQLYLLPLRTINMIIVMATLTNIILSVLIKDTISMPGWLVRVLILFIGTSGLVSTVDWPTFKRSSITLRLILGERCAGSAEK